MCFNIPLPAPHTVHVQAAECELLNEQQEQLQGVSLEAEQLRAQVQALRQATSDLPALQGELGELQALLTARAQLQQEAGDADKVHFVCVCGWVWSGARFLYDERDRTSPACSVCMPFCTRVHCMLCVTDLSFTCRVVCLIMYVRPTHTQVRLQVEQLRAAKVDLVGLREELKQLQDAHEEAKGHVRQLKEQVCGCVSVFGCCVFVFVPLTGCPTSFLTAPVLPFFHAHIHPPHTPLPQAEEIKVLQEERSQLSAFVERGAAEAAELQALRDQAGELSGVTAELQQTRATLLELQAVAKQLEQHRCGRRLV